MNSSNKVNNSKIRPQNKWAYAFSQYFMLLKKFGGKIIYFAQWSFFNFGFHLIVAWGNNIYIYIF
jgi:hypothetical protein